MGQVYLGFRSLLVKLAVFVVMAALLAWAIGGTLWPRTAVGVVGTAVMVDGHSIALVDRLRSDGSRAHFALALLEQDGKVVEFWPPEQPEQEAWSDALSPVANPDATRGAAAFGRDDRWSIVEFGTSSTGGHPLQDGNPVIRAVGGRLEAARVLDAFARGDSAQSSGVEASATGEASSAG
jgi:hypothetical protein